jgi:hypothetical protein
MSKIHGLILSTLYIHCDTVSDLKSNHHLGINSINAFNHRVNFPGPSKNQLQWYYRSKVTTNHDWGSPVGTNLGTL